MKAEETFLKQIAKANTARNKGFAKPVRMMGRPRPAVQAEDLVALGAEMRAKALQALAAGDTEGARDFPVLFLSPKLEAVRDSLQTPDDIRSMDMQVLKLSVEYAFMANRIGNDYRFQPAPHGVPWLSGIAMSAFGSLSGRKDIVGFYAPFLREILSKQLADPKTAEDILLAAVTRHLLGDLDEPGLAAALDAYRRAVAPLDALIAFHCALQDHSKRSLTLPGVFALWPVISLYVIDQFHIDPGENFGFLLDQAKTATNTYDDLIEAYEVALA